MTSVVNINDVLESHVTLDIGCVDRLYLNAYIPNLQVGNQVKRFCEIHLGQPIASPVIIQKIGNRLRRGVSHFAEEHEIETRAGDSSDSIRLAIAPGRPITPKPCTRRSWSVAAANASPRATVSSTISAEPNHYPDHVLRPDCPVRPVGDAIQIEPSASAECSASSR
jgi:hypothetical protein